MGELVVGRITLSPALSAALETPTAWGDGDEVALPWRAPAGTDLKDEAEAQLAAAEEALRTADRSLALKWLGSLGVLTAGKMGAEDARLKAAAYVRMLDYPEYCYTEETLRNTARLFNWFPSYSEISGFLDARAREPRALVWRLKRIAEGPRKRSRVGRLANWEKLGDVKRVTPEQVDTIMERHGLRNSSKAPHRIPSRRW